MKKLSLSIISLFSSIFITCLAEATPVITLDAPDRVGAGTNFDVKVNISGLQSENILLGAFQFDFSFSSNTPGYDLFYLISGTHFGDALGEIPSEAVGYINSPTPTTGPINFIEVSLLSSAELANKQSQDSFTLATIELSTPRFESAANRVARVKAENFVLSDDLGSIMMDL